MNKGEKRERKKCNQGITKGDRESERGGGDRQIDGQREGERERGQNNERMRP